MGLQRSCLAQRIIQRRLQVHQLLLCNTGPVRSYIGLILCELARHILLGEVLFGLGGCGQLLRYQLVAPPLGRPLNLLGTLLGQIALLAHDVDRLESPVHLATHGTGALLLELGLHVSHHFVLVVLLCRLARRLEVSAQPQLHLLGLIASPGVRCSLIVHHIAQAFRCGLQVVVSVGLSTLRTSHGLTQCLALCSELLVHIVIGLLLDGYLCLELLYVPLGII